MEYAGLGLYAKDFLTLADLEKLFAIGERSKIAGFFGRMYCALSAVRVMAAGFVAPWHILCVDNLVKIHGLRSEIKQTTDESPVKIIDRVSCYLAASLGQTPEAVKTQTNIRSIDELIFHIIQKDIDKKISLIRAEHDPSKFLEDIQKDFSRAKTKKTRSGGKITPISNFVRHQSKGAL